MSLNIFKFLNDSFKLFTDVLVFILILSILIVIVLKPLFYVFSHIIYIDILYSLLLLPLLFYYCMIVIFLKGLKIKE